MRGSLRVAARMVGMARPVARRRSAGWPSTPVDGATPGGVIRPRIQVDSSRELSEMSKLS